MRFKQLFLSVVMTILCMTQAMAAFTPGTYYLQTASGTYIDALAVNTSNPGAKFQTSSSTAFTFTAVSGGYTIQNASNGNYLLYSTANNWDTKMSASASETNYAGTWTVNEDANGKISISRQYESTTYYLGNGNTNAGTGVYSGQTSAVWYTLENAYVVTGNGTTGTLTGYNIPSGKSFTLTMEVENNGASYNQWGSSILATGTNAFPEKSTVRSGFQLYLQSSTNAQKKLDLVAAGTDHILTSVDYNENFTVVMDYADGSLHVTATDASGNSSETTVSTTLTEITSFAYGLPTGINIKTLDITINSNAIEVDDNWHTLKTNALTSGTSFYWYAASTTATELGQIAAGPTDANIDQYLWKIQGNDSQGYTLLNKATGTYITNPTTINDNGSAVVRLTVNADKYFYTNERSFQLASPNDSYYLASYSVNHNTVRLFNSSNYAGSIVTISAPYEERQYTVNVSGANGNGGVIYAERNYLNNAELVSYIELTTGVLSAIPVDGYQANITMNGTTITVTYTANQVVDNPQAICDLLNRIGGAGTSNKFVTRLDEGLFAGGKDKFIIGNQDGKPYIQGSSMTAIATGINWYLNHDAHINISWNQLTADIASASLPAATAVEKTCDADYRYYLNYCTFGYSMTTWTWDRWQKEIDWMALHGINMPLQIIGLEEVWRKVLVQYNYTDDEAKAFAAGPAFTAWWGMNNLEGWGGTTDDAWFARQAKLGKDICDRMKELGMQPVLPGFAAIVPHDFTSKNPAYASESQGNWGGSFVRPWIMDPSGAKFSEVAEKYYKALEEVLGTSKYYSMDPFHEGGAISSGKYSEGYRAIYDAMNDNCGSDTKWVIQQWQWAGYQRNSLTAVPAGRLIVLDLFADGQPAFDSYNGYAPQEAVFSTIPNFGGRSGFMGRLDNMASNYFTYKGKYSTLKGIGAAPEAIESVPVVYDLLFELPWMGTAPNVTAWVADYATNRYGTANTNAQKAWESIHQSAMAFGADAIQGPIEDVWAARPNLDATPASKWGKTIANAKSIYTLERRQKLTEAFITLVGENENLSGSNYEYDLIEVGSQVMADYAYDLLLSIKEAKNAGNTELFNQRKQLFLDLILDMDAFKGTHHMFRLGNWTQTARDAAAEVQGATTATPDWYELDNARTIITTWGDRGPSEWGLRDYSYRSWQGLLKDYYYPRWVYYFSHDCTAPSAGWFYSEWNWAHELEGTWGANAKGTQMKAERTYYSPTAEGNTVEEAKKLLTKYILPVRDRKFYTFTEQETSNTTTYFFDLDHVRLVRYTTDSNSGTVDDWGDKMNTTKWNVTEASSIDVNIPASGYSTFYTPIQMKVPAGATAYVAKVDLDAVDAPAIRFKTLEQDIIPANTGVLIKADASSTIQVTPNAEEVAEEESDIDGGIEKFSVAQTTDTKADLYFYTMSGGTFKYFTGTAIPGFKGYLHIALPYSQSQSRDWTVYFDGETETSIEATNNVIHHEAMYDLSGRSVQNATRGLYIAGNKKIMVY